MISRRLVASRSRNSAVESCSASGPRRSGPSRAVARPVITWTLPNPRRSQYHNRERIGASRRNSSRRCVEFGGSANNSRPVIRGSTTIVSSPSSRSSTRLPRRSAACRSLPGNTAGEIGGRGADGNRFQVTAGKTHGQNAAADDRQHATTHRLYLGQFRHGCVAFPNSFTLRTLPDFVDRLVCAVCTCRRAARISSTGILAKTVASV